MDRYLHYLLHPDSVQELLAALADELLSLLPLPPWMRACIIAFVRMNIKAFHLMLRRRLEPDAEPDDPRLLEQRRRFRGV